jgi:fido (protein-threonine AMPylation protein)
MDTIPLIYPIEKSCCNFKRKRAAPKLDQAHLQEIHRRIFEKVYPWAGELRQVNIARGNCRRSKQNPSMASHAFDGMAPSCFANEGLVWLLE